MGNKMDLYDRIKSLSLPQVISRYNVYAYSCSYNYENSSSYLFLFLFFKCFFKNSTSRCVELYSWIMIPSSEIISIDHSCDLIITCAFVIWYFCSDSQSKIPTHLYRKSSIAMMHFVGLSYFQLHQAYVKPCTCYLQIFYSPWYNIKWCHYAMQAMVYGTDNKSLLCTNRNYMGQADHTEILENYDIVGKPGICDRKMVDLVSQCLPCWLLGGQTLSLIHFLCLPWFADPMAQIKHMSTCALHMALLGSFHLLFLDALLLFIEQACIMNGLQARVDNIVGVFL